MSDNLTRVAFGVLPPMQTTAVGAIEKGESYISMSQDLSGGASRLLSDEREVPRENEMPDCDLIE